jgi:hypothetical protein
MTRPPTAAQQGKTGRPHSVSSREQVVDTMIGLTRLSYLHRTIVAGSDSLELCLALRRRGFVRATTIASWRVAKGQHTAGLIMARTRRRASRPHSPRSRNSSAPPPPSP